MNTSKKFEKLTELVGETAACNILNDLIAEEYNRQTPNAEADQRNAEWEQFVDRYTGAAADDLITEEILDEYANI